MLQLIMQNFELILTLSVVVCLVFYIIDGKSYRKERNRLYKVFKTGTETDDDRNLYAKRLSEANYKGIKKKYRDAFASAQTNINNRKQLSGQQLHWIKVPVYPKERFIEFFGGMFWVLFIVWFLRSFVCEPFQIPSSSMEPTLQEGDFILTSKFAYGVRLPVIHTKILPFGEVNRGDVVVFRYPENPKIDYIKRIVGLPGDKLVFQDGQVSINGKPIPLNATNKTRFGYKDGQRYDVYRETMSDKEHTIQFNHNPLMRSNSARFSRSAQRFKFNDGDVVVIPEGYYFAMGDNRDASADSRFWGFVPDENLVGRAFFVWMNSDCVLGKGYCSRVGHQIK